MGSIGWTALRGQHPADWLAGARCIREGGGILWPTHRREVREMTAKTGAIPTKQTDEPVKWQCLTCEYVVESATLPFSCPRCGASRVKFVEMSASGEAADEE